MLANTGRISSFCLSLDLSTQGFHKYLSFLFFFSALVQEFAILNWSKSDATNAANSKA